MGWLGMDITESDRPSDEAADWLARRLRAAHRRRGSVALAVSGGSTAPPLFAALLGLDVPWETVTVWQVDERVAPEGHRDRNRVQLDVLPCAVRSMPVTSRDLRAAARRYAAGLPDRFDVVHLGLGADGHTASWPPEDPVVESARRVELTGEFNGRRRMTLTPLVVNAARSRLVLTTGGEKAEMVGRWVGGDPALPIARVRWTDTFLFLDAAASAQLPG